MPSPIGNNGAMDEIKRGERKRWAIAFGGLALIVSAAGAAGALSEIGGAGRLMMLCLIGVAVITGAILIDVSRGRAAAKREPLINRVDQLHRSRSRLLWFFAAEVLLFAPTVAQSIQDLLNRTATTATVGRWVIDAGLMCMMVGTLMTLLGVGFGSRMRHVMDDELSQALRAQAIQTGFVVFIVGCVGSFVAGLVEPRWAVLALPFVTMGSVAVAALHFVVLDRSAGGDA